MSRESVEVVRRLFEAVARRDTDTVMSLYARDVEWDGSRSRWTEVLVSAETGPRWRGHTALRRFFRVYYEMWDSLELSLAEVIDAGDRVVAMVNIRARGKASGVDVDWPGQASVWTIRDGQVARVDWCSTRDDALKAAGLGQ